MCERVRERLAVSEWPCVQVSAWLRAQVPVKGRAGEGRGQRRSGGGSEVDGDTVSGREGVRVRVWVRGGERLVGSSREGDGGRGGGGCIRTRGWGRVKMGGE